METQTESVPPQEATKVQSIPDLPNSTLPRAVDPAPNASNLAQTVQRTIEVDNLPRFQMPKPFQV